MWFHSENRSRTKFKVEVGSLRSISWQKGPSLRIGLEKNAPSTPESASAEKPINHTHIMPSAYKSVVNRQESSDDDMSDDGAFLGEEESGSEASTSTVRASSSDSDEGRAPPKATHLPLELKNRILMLTSRGVSSRYADISKLSLP